MKKAPTISKLKKKAWESFSIYIRTRDAVRDKDKDGYNGENADCITCFRMYPSFGVGCLQAGHFIPGRNNFVLFDERQVHGQCYNCNVNLKGNWPSYLKVMKEKWGEAEVQVMLDTHKTMKQFKNFELVELAESFKEKTRALQQLT